jgi:hypothetical protein
MLDHTEEDKDMSWECCKVVDYCKEKGDVNSSNHKYSHQTITCKNS